ncbi:hypothetical protein FHU10_0952 [Serratia fonticola]|uniref:Uncharacterized protein n=1 Tax=Serratia fonticola TaxID=47917 RepID=A0A542D7F3_SERFO|nr:hypothetical protein FHU09_1496 [Serratia fonticola]TQI98985.1 hypothetical protein FHU11_4554 [Serratia fonticola]TVZ68510.1 hypothetical protein FHU10_0952 [Serratia fonticola]
MNFESQLGSQQRSDLKDNGYNNMGIGWCSLVL